MKPILFYVFACLMLIPNLCSALPQGDTVGIVESVRIVGLDNDLQTIQVWLKDVTNDRFNCIASQGYISISESHQRVNSKKLNMIYSLAISAQLSVSIWQSIRVEQTLAQMEYMYGCFKV